ncbi:MAG: nitronate monooxygenase [Candidatus Eisenbacteria bacterium]|uniref:Nitronate monooxygenase n=1 Tax=Eiseniibacteriota bacterium TaxID=2212470 RepID=A0A849SRT1_UNCEI|nr:nitronate monooxygenase [Candidatus Eisenbacteria bacterium]
MSRLDTALTRHAHIEVPLICGAMYPCSNPELVAAVSEAGGIGIVQPVSMTYVHGHEFRAGLRLIRGLTSKPIGMNALIEKTSQRHHERMARWVGEAIEEGVRFFVTSLGNPRWVVQAAHAAGGVVYHDVTEPKWAAKAVDAGVDGLIAVNARAGGHAGPHAAERLIELLAPFHLPVVCAGGIGEPAGFVRSLELGYAGAQLGTRFIATPECRASDAYKQAIVKAVESDVVLSERITGVPVAVLDTPYVKRTGLKASPLSRWLLRNPRTKHFMRGLYLMRAGWQLKRASLDATGTRDYWQAGKSVAGIDAIEPAGQIVRRFADAARRAEGGPSPLDRAATPLSHR